MKNIVDDYFSFYKIFRIKYSDILSKNNVGILSNFLENKDHIIEFHKRFVQPNSPKIVLCGINPGRFGAGRTGIPFIDFDSLSEMLPNIKNHESEKSAKFFFSVVKAFGEEEFYKNFHVTNISWYGFYQLDKMKNVNYDDKRINTEIAIFLIDKFVEEMNLIQPDIIIPLSKNVYYELESLKEMGKIQAKIGPRLNHPGSPIVSKNKNLWKDIYVQTLTNCLCK